MNRFRSTFGLEAPPFHPANVQQFVIIKTNNFNELGGFLLGTFHRRFPTQLFGN
jgi:hypothetical protein